MTLTHVSLPGAQNHKVVGLRNERFWNLLWSMTSVMKDFVEVDLWRPKKKQI